MSIFTLENVDKRQAKHFFFFSWTASHAHTALSSVVLISTGGDYSFVKEKRLRGTK